MAAALPEAAEAESDVMEETSPLTSPPPLLLLTPAPPPPPPLLEPAAREVESGRGHQTNKWISSLGESFFLVLSLDTFLNAKVFL